MIDFDLKNFDAVAEAEEIYSLNKELNLAWEIIEETGANLFLTGRAGTGKTTFLKNLRESSSKRMVVLAPTGVAAINAAGTTLHSFFQLPFAPFVPGRGFLTDDKKFLNFSKQKKRLIASLSLIVIDEISMVRPDMLDAIDYILRRVRHSSLPFGGLQLLLIGDLRQLPPVVKDEEWEMMKDIYSSPYFFESVALKTAGYQTVELSTVYRQTDRDFIEILNMIRDGHINSDTLNKLNNRCMLSSRIVDDEGYIRLTTHNNRAAMINNNRLSQISGQEFCYEAETDGIFPETSFPADSVLRLKPGTQVMFVKNDIGAERKYYNGLIGKVVSLSEEKIRVQIPGEESIIDVEKVEWENTRYSIDETTKKVVQETIGSFRQYPLQLAWAITIHKSQGLTFEKAIIDAGHSFAPGQTYVALSRCRSLEGLLLDGPIPAHAVITDKDINDFISYCEANMPDEEKVKELRNGYIFTLFSEMFDFESLRRNYADFSRYAIEYLVPLHPQEEDEIESFRSIILKDVCDVARKFTGAYNEDKIVRLLSDSDSSLTSRIKNGAQYFVKILTEFKDFLVSIPKGIDNRSYAERLNNTFDSLIYGLQLKILVLSQLASERGLAETTIGNHVMELISMDRIKLEEVVEDSMYKKIKGVLETNQDKTLKEIMMLVEADPSLGKIPFYLLNIIFRN